MRYCFPLEFSFWFNKNNYFTGAARQCQLYVKGIWNREFISAVTAYVLSTLIRYENGTFQKRSSNWRNLETPVFRFHVETRIQNDW